jgi:HD superfamily phosphodiesterase
LPETPVVGFAGSRKGLLSNEGMRQHINNMRASFKEIWQLAQSYLDTRSNDIHTAISVGLAYELLEREGGDEDIVIPAMILHDVGWKKVPDDLQLKAFGPKAESPEINRIHEVEGMKVAREILEMVCYDEEKIEEIVEIIGGHDSRRDALSLNDEIVKDADKLFRYTRKGFHIDAERFGETHDVRLTRLRYQLERWFFTDAARGIAMMELANRRKESSLDKR